MHLCTRESVRNTTLDNPKKPKTVVLAPGPCRVWLRVTDRMGSRTGPFYLPYAFIVSIWNLVIVEVPRSFGHEDPSNCRFVSGTFARHSAPSLCSSSFRSLGHHFTCQLAILLSHTTGPYAFI